MDEMLNMEHALQQLATLIRRHAPNTGTYQTAISNLSVMHATQLSEPLESVYQPSICVVAQGAKTATLAGETYRYDSSTYLVTSVELPIIGRIVEASAEIPYLSLKLSFDTASILKIVEKMNWPASEGSETGRGITVNQMSLALLEVIIRLMQLLDAPMDIPVLAPLVTQEILYRMLQSEQGAFLSQFATTSSHAYNIAQSIRFINQHYERQLPISHLAKSVSMSESAFYKHFKRVTAMSPLQYQKTIRLQEARRLMLMESLHASDAAFRVGYESPSQFSREYARMYGQPPTRDIQEFRDST